MNSGIDFIVMMSWGLMTLWLTIVLNEDDHEFVEHHSSETYGQYVFVEMFNCVLNLLAALFVAFVFNIPVFLIGFLLLIFKL